ncbi:unnamed protein product [Phyllotreta striolata]|uniref:Uncharacterized protein n=1 Tax=Phyllotreta striolata TaxID=444603 RepID=A0A9N9XL14_PHYSR|nr:unnamed protein product [Phyllotreta striolata]
MKFIWLIIISASILNLENAMVDTAIMEDYIAPANIKYPYGDEVQFSFNVLDKDANPFPCGDQKAIEKRLGKCPIDRVKLQTIPNPFVECPNYAVVPTLPSSDCDKSQPNLGPGPDVLCKRCDLKLTSDGLGVLIECCYCLDVASPNREADRELKDIQYKAYFIQISNYSSVDVIGSENFDP